MSLGAWLAAVMDSAVVVVDIPGLAASAFNGGPATASITFGRDGTIKDQDGASLGNWISPRSSTVGDGYDVKGAKTSGDALTSGPANDTYAQMSSSQTFTLTNATVSTVKVWTGTFSIRAHGATTALDAQTGCTITAERG